MAPNSLGGIDIFIENKGFFHHFIENKGPFNPFTFR